MQNNVGIYASQISGHLWAPNGAMDALATVTVGSTSVASITFSGIPQGYKNLQIQGIARDARAISGANPINMTFNADTTYTNYRQHYLYGDGASVGAGTVQASGSYASGGDSAGASNSANIFAANIINILDYANTGKNKTVRVLHGIDTNGAGQIVTDSSLWLSTSAISAIELTPKSSSGFVQYTQFTLYGIK